MSTATTKLYWMLNNEVLNTDLVKRVNVPNMIHKQSELELQLIITSPIPTMDTGVYTCVAENEWERIERHTSIRFDISDGKHLKTYLIMELQIILQLIHITSYPSAVNST